MPSVVSRSFQGRFDILSGSPLALTPGPPAPSAGQRPHRLRHLTPRRGLSARRQRTTDLTQVTPVIFSGGCPVASRHCPSERGRAVTVAPVESGTGPQPACPGCTKQSAEIRANGHEFSDYGNRWQPLLSLIHKDSHRLGTEIPPRLLPHSTWTTPQIFRCCLCPAVDVQLLVDVLDMFAHCEDSRVDL